MAKSATKKVNENQTTDLFVQQVLSSAEGSDVKECNLILNTSEVIMKYNHQSGKNAPADKYSSELKVGVYRLSFDGGALTEGVARRLAKLEMGSIDDWIKENTTTGDTDKLQTCITH